MKKVIFTALMVLCAGFAGCGSDDEDVISQTYADDDFALTERNIREKIVGSWKIAQLRQYSTKSGWQALGSDDMGEKSRFVVNADGSCATSILVDAHYRVSKDTVIVSSRWLFIRTVSDNSTTTLRMPVGVDISQSEAEYAIKKARSEGSEAGFVQDDYIKLLVREMKKNAFTLEEPDVTYARKVWIERQ